MFQLVVLVFRNFKPLCPFLLSVYEESSLANHPKELSGRLLQAFPERLVEMPAKGFEVLRPSMRQEIVAKLAVADSSHLFHVKAVFSFFNLGKGKSGNPEPVNLLCILPSYYPLPRQAYADFSAYSHYFLANENVFLLASLSFNYQIFRLGI